LTLAACALSPAAAARGAQVRSTLAHYADLSKEAIRHRKSTKTHYPLKHQPPPRAGPLHAGAL